MTKMTGKKAASEAGKVLSDPTSTTEERSAAASTLTQRAGRKSPATNEGTSARAATRASKVLSNPKSTPTEKTAAASALAQVSQGAQTAKPPAAPKAKPPAKPVAKPAPPKPPAARPKRK